jgi:hypothetical protein
MNGPTLKPLNLVALIANDHMTRCLPDDSDSTPGPTLLVESIPNEDKTHG